MNEALTTPSACEYALSLKQPWATLLVFGPKTIEAFRQALAGAQTIVWNGTLGVAEMPNFAKGTNAIIEMLVERTRAGATTWHFTPSAMNCQYKTSPVGPAS